MKISKKGVCFFLALCLLVGTLGVTAFATEEIADEKGIYTVTVLGDSIAAGYASENYPDFTNILDGTRVPGSYADLFAEDLQAFFRDSGDSKKVELLMDAHIAWRTTELLNALSSQRVSGGAYDPCYSDIYTSDLMEGWACTDFFRRAFGIVRDNKVSFASVGKKIAEHIEQSDLVTVNFGANDIYSYGMCAVLGKWLPFLTGTLPDADLTSIDGINALLRAYIQFAMNAEEGQRHSMLADFVNAMELGLARYTNNISVIIKAVQTLNPNAKIAVIGVKPPIMNPIRVGEYTFDVAAYIDPLIVRANAANAYACEKYGCLYVDIKGTENTGFSNDLDLSNVVNIFFDLLKAVHPTSDEYGHGYMAQCLYDTVIPTLSAPKNVRVTTGTAFLAKPHISWEPVPDASGYVVYRSLFRNTGYHPVKIVKGAAATDLTAVVGLSYYYKVSTLLNPCGSQRSPLSESTSAVKAGSIFQYIAPIFSFGK